MAEKKQTVELSEMEAVELQFKRLQIQRMQREMAEDAEKGERLSADRARQMTDWLKNERQRVHRQTICKHRKGGRDNKFAKGNDANYSININTYPDGRMCISCTRCGKEVWKPLRALKKNDPKLFQEQWNEWQKWLEYPTDNSPSGSKIFELVTEAA